MPLIDLFCIQGAAAAISPRGGWMRLKEEAIAVIIGIATVIGRFLA